MTTEIRVLIVDDHPVVRHGLRMVLSMQPDIQLVGEAADGAEGIQKARELQPDIIIMDLKMPITDGATAIREIARLYPQIRILILTAFDTGDTTNAALRAGAHGCLLKDTTPQQLVRAVRAVVRGDTVLHPRIASTMLEQLKVSTSRPSPHEQLTAREMEVLAHLGKGVSNSAIAKALNITQRTVTTHIHNILMKLDLTNRTQAALYACDWDIAES
jgi:DNA-binding NarL/FixJ family response regulator